MVRLVAVFMLAVSMVACASPRIEHGTVTTKYEQPRSRTYCEMYIPVKFGDVWSQQCVDYETEHWIDYNIVIEQCEETPCLTETLTVHHNDWQSIEIGQFVDYRST